MGPNPNRAALLLLASLFLSLALFGLPAGPGVVAASPAASKVSIVPGASTLTTTAYSPDVVTVVIGVNNTTTYTFNTAGTYPYHCAIHPNMVGKVIVKPAAGTASTGGGGIPEFPYQLAAAVGFAVILVLFYLIVRRPIP